MRRAQFRTVGGKATLVSKRSDADLTRSGSLPSLRATAAGASLRSNKTSSLKQRGILSEVVRAHRGEEVEGCKLGPDEDLAVSKTIKGMHKSSSVGGFSLSSKMRAKAEEFMPVAPVPMVAEVLPKVVEVFNHRPGDRPRKVTVERRKKMFESLDLENLLFPIDFKSRSWKKDHWLQLDDFDNTDFDIRTPEEWMALRYPEDGRGPLPLKGKALRFREEGDGVFEDCLVDGYDADIQRFLVRWTEDEDSHLDEAFPISKWQLLFEGEDPTVFVDRIKFAFEALRRVQSRARLNFFIDNMPIDDIQCLDVDQIARILDLAKNSAALRDPAIGPAATDLVREANLDFARTMNKIILIWCMMNAPQKKENQDSMENHDSGHTRVESASPVGSNSTLAIFGDINVDELEDEHENSFERPARWYALYPVPEYNFADTFSQFCFESLYIKPEVATTLVAVATENQALMEACMYTTHFQRLMKPEQFRQIQRTTVAQMAHRIKDQWTAVLQKIVLDNFKKVGKGWFSIHETNLATYRQGKMRKLLTVIRFMMQDSLRYFILNSIADYCLNVGRFCPVEVSVHDLKSVEAVFQERPPVLPAIRGGSLELRPPCRPQPPEQIGSEAPKPGDGLFVLEIKVNEEKTNFVYNVDAEAVVDLVTEALDQGLQGVAYITQIDASIVPQLFKTVVHKQVLNVPDNYDPWINRQREELVRTVRHALPALADYIALFKPYVDLLLMEPTAIVEEKREAEASDEEIRLLILDHMEKEKEVLNAIKETVTVGLFEVSCVGVRKVLAGKHKKATELLLELMLSNFRDAAQGICDSFNGIYSQLRKVPKDIDGLTELREYMTQVPSEIVKLTPDMKRCIDTYGTLENFGIRLTGDDTFQRWRVFGSPKYTNDLMEEIELKLKDAQAVFAEEMAEEQREFDDTLLGLASTVKGFAQYDNIDKIQEIFNNVESVDENLKKAAEDVKRFNQRELLFGKDRPTNYDEVAALTKEWEPFSSLWKTAYHWLKDSKKWMNGPFDKIDAKHCQDAVFVGGKTLFKTVRSLEKRGDAASVLAIAQDIKSKIDDFAPNVPIVTGLRNPGMRDRHWEQVSALVGADVTPSMEEFTLSKFLDLGMMDKAQEIGDIGDRSGKELNIENQLKAMIAAWDNVFFDCKQTYRNTETYILKGADEVSALLDEQVVNTQAAQFSPFNKPFKEEIDEWNEKLQYVSECIENWLKVQRAWMYLQPIFDSPDIMKQLPAEGKLFKRVDVKWRQVMGRVHSNSHALTQCTAEGLLGLWIQSNADLDSVQKGLDLYLETKRGAFARFYFLSNDELLEILSQTKDPLRVQPFLSKVFEAMKELTFTPELVATQMHSKEGEVIDFVTPVVTNGKNVEHWMTDVENQMLLAIREVVAIGIKTYVEMPRTEWVLVNPGQVCLQSSQVHWTSEVEQAIKNATMSDYFTKLDDQLLALVRLVRGNITKLQRMSIGALVVIDVHAKDTVETLAKENITNPMSFEWIGQLRYYWYVDDRNTENLWVRMVQTPFPYGYEYLGNSFRLVITPLTDMCYMTLMGAQSLNLGGAPAGPAGTGKTETTKDLAKALAKQCVVFNCSPEMDYLMVGKFFKGLASSGAWCCFDEFNRIFIEVLSVIAQQLLQLFSAKRELASYNEVAELEFDSTMIQMKPTFNVFITMNPGYAGRSELPDNLAALFRPMAMMVPDYGLIGEISFYAFGFEKGRHLAKKMVTTFQLCSEQLSAQCHYDYGMRAVKTVIEAAGLNKRKFPDQSEGQILLRALRDVNVPKFLRDDLPLFDNIISDLFPGVERPPMDYGRLDEMSHDRSRFLHLQPIPYFIKKQFELFDMIQVRHGMMLVGPTGGGKTCCYRTLQAACTSLCNPKDHESQFQKVHVHCLNPKAITQNQLYGSFDEVTREWSDGVAAELIRNATRDNHNPDHHWVMFDGPVDALWIESMNTVLDDNKKLCLVSGEIIALTAKMRIQFEVEDLEVASPATVSRCGMIYMEPESLGFAPFWDSWLEQLPETFQLFRPQYRQTLRELFETIVEPCLMFCRKRLVECVKTQDNNLIQALLKLLNCYFKSYVPNEVKLPASFKDAVIDLGAALVPLYMFCLIWSLGASCDGPSRKKFSDYVWGFVSEEYHEKAEQDMAAELVPVPPMRTDFTFVGIEVGESLYDYYYSLEQKAWIPWMQTIPAFEVARSSKYEEIVVPSSDSVSLSYIFQLLVTNDYHVLCPGPTGTGKSANIALWLSKKAPDNFQGVFINFSAQTHVNQLQDLIDAKLDKRRRRVFGPPAGKKMVLFIDDLNMPLKEYYGAQPPIELIRQWHDHGGWFNRKELTHFLIVDVIMVSALGPPGGGRTFITERIKRHYSSTAYIDLSDTSITQIFSVMSNYFFSAFDATVLAKIPAMISCTIDVFRQALEELLPTPKKSHYLFNLRDIWKVFLGLCSLHHNKANSPLVVVRCWSHEIQRIFGDRLTDSGDLAWLKVQVEKGVTEKFGMDVAEVFANERIVFSSFMTQEIDSRYYEEIQNLNAMKTTIEEYLDDYNEVNAITMPLVMFLDACEHVARIARVLDQPSGHVLLLGVGGSGRQSLTRLSAHSGENDVYQIEVAKGYGMNEFKENLKECLMKCGVDNKVQVFLFCDTQIVKEDFVEAINNVLNSGDVPNLYANEDFEGISTSCRQLCQSMGMNPTKANLFTAYLSRVKKNVHVVLAFSPVGDSFRNRLRMFPSLVNCCTIDWFHEWPAEALYSVAKQQMMNSNVELPDLESSLKMFQTIHQDVERASKRFLEATSRNVYITPTSYLELLSSFTIILADKRKQTGTLQKRYDVGLTKIEAAEDQVAGLQQMLIDKKPALEATNQQVGEMMVNIAKDQADAAVVSEAVSKEEAAAQVKQAETQAINDDAQNDLDEAMPALAEAVQCLRKLKVEHIREIRALGQPPNGVRLACEAVCIMFQIKPVSKQDPNNPQNKIKDYWDVAKSKLLVDANKLIDDLVEYDRDHIPDSVIRAIKPYIEREDFEPARIKQASIACEALCLWCGAMYKYHHVALKVAPKKQLLKEAQEELAICAAQLAAAQNRLAEVNAKIEQLQADYEGAVAKQKELADDMNLCEVKLDRAHRLIGGLGGEKKRWGENVRNLTTQMTLLPGDCIIAAGMVSYVGPFTSAFRVELQNGWVEELDRNGSLHNDDCSMAAVLGEPVKIQQWIVAALPNDTLSIENGIIIDRSRRWPLMIDPQRQANKYIKNMGKDHTAGIDVCKLSEKSFLKTLEIGIQFGHWILLENIGINLDPALEPVLGQQKVRDGSGFVIKLGDKSIDYDDNFKFFMTTTLPNPHYSPETSVKVTLLNFAITPTGLEDQMLGIVVAKERPDLQEQKEELVVQNAKNNRTLKEIEDDILRLLATSEGDVLEDDKLVDKVTAGKQVSNEINEKKEVAKVTEANIDTARESYRPVAYRTAVLFFCIVELTNIDPMYQYSLQWFQQLFCAAIDQSPKSDSLDQRLEILKDYFTEALYQNVCRGLFEKDKTLFSFALCVRILKGDNQLDDAELRFLLVGPTADLVETGPKIPADWVGAQRWNEILTLAQLSAFDGLHDNFAQSVSAFKKIYDSVEADKEPLPSHWEKTLGPMQRLCFMRAMRMDCLQAAIITFISNQIGQKFVEPPTFDIAKSFADSSNITPLVFILSPGTDPVADVITYADKLGMSKRFESISLGQGQGPKATKMIEGAMATGGWVLLSNCHLMESWMSSLEAIVEQLNPDQMSKQFRLWLTSMPAKSFPVQVLQNGVKMTNEPPSGLRANLLRSYSAIQDTLFAESNKPDDFKTLLFGFCFFHAVVQDRRKFGPIGWNISYSFTPEDLQVCRQQLMTFVNQYDEVPYKVLNFLGAKINYGGRVTDDKDKLLISTILKTYICPEAVELREEYKYSTSGLYYAPSAASVQEFVDYIRTMPLFPMPEAFGLHENCNITCAQDQALSLLVGMQSMVQLGGGGGGGQSAEEVMDTAAVGIQARLPTPFPLDICEKKFPTMYEESMNTVVKQECLRYNKLLWEMAATLKDFRKAIKGLIVMTFELESLGKSVFVNEQPELWAKKGPLSLKPLSSWYLDILARVEFFQMWYDLGKSPPVFWISGIFFPQAFFTGAMQNFARKYNEEIDLLSFRQRVMDHVKDPKGELTEPPEDGVNIYGIFMEGCRWCSKLHKLVDSRPKELFTDLPTLLFVPVKHRVVDMLDYRCPCYKVVSRKGTLLTTGHSTNFVLYIELPTDQIVDKWIKAGVAAFLALKF